jgi:hypothetical protein
LLTVDQRRWHDLKARLRMAQPLHVPPKPSESAKIRSRFYELTTSRPFKRVNFIVYVENRATTHNFILVLSLPCPHQFGHSNSALERGRGTNTTNQPVLFNIRVSHL